jgi:hypothetical protein
LFLQAQYSRVIGIFKVAIVLEYLGTFYLDSTSMFHKIKDTLYLASSSMFQRYLRTLLVF